MTHERDMIFRSGGSNLLLQPTRSGGGYDAQFAPALDLADEAVGRGGRGR